MLKKSLYHTGILLLVIALLVLSGCELGIGNGDKTDNSPPKEDEDPALQGDLGGIASQLVYPPVHNTLARTVVNGTNAVVQFFWDWDTEGDENGPGVKEGKFWYNGGKALKARVLVTAKSGYVFTQTLKKAEVLDAFSVVITGNIDTYTLSGDNTELDFTFFYTVDRAELVLSPLTDIELVAGSSNMPDFIEGTTLANLDPAAPPVTKYIYEDADTYSFYPLPAADEPFKVKVEATAAYGYKWPDNFNYAGVYISAAKVTPLVSGSVLSLTLEYAGALEPIDSLAGIQPLFTGALQGGITQVPGKLTLATGADAPNFTAEELKWTGLEEDSRILAGRNISTPVKLIPKKGYTFTESVLTEDAIAAAINPSGGGTYNYDQEVEGVKKDHTLEFILTYPVPAVPIVEKDLALNMISSNSLADFYQPRIGQPVYTKLTANPGANFTLDSIPIRWFDQPGNVLTNYIDGEIRASITLKAKPGYTFKGIVKGDLQNILTGFTKNAGKGPDVAVIGTPDETLIFTLTYAKDKLSPQITISGGTVTATVAALNAGGGLAEMFTLGTTNTVRISAAPSGPVDLATDPVIPAGKTLELSTGAKVKTSEKLDAKGSIRIEENGSFTANGDSDITGHITIGKGGTLTLNGTSNDPLTNKISGNISFTSAGSKLEISAGTTQIAGSQLSASTGVTAQINLSGSAVLEFTGNVTATNVTIASGGTSKINIPQGNLTIGSGASLVLNSGGNDTGELKGTVTVKSDGAIIDGNPDRSAWKVAEGGSIVIEYGGKAIINPDNNSATVLVGTNITGPTKSDYIQLVANGAKFTNKASEYVLTGSIVLAKNFPTPWKVIVEGTFTIKADVTLDISGDMIVGAGTGSKLVIEKDAVVTGKHAIINDSNNIESSCFSAGTYDWVPLNGNTEAHWKKLQAES